MMDLTLTKALECFFSLVSTAEGRLVQRMMYSCLGAYICGMPTSLIFSSSCFRVFQELPFFYDYYMLYNCMQ